MPQQVPGGLGRSSCIAFLQGRRASSTVSNPKVQERLGWRLQAAKLRDEYALPSDYRPWTGNDAVQLLGVREDPRSYEVLDIAFAVACRAKPGVPVRGVTQGLWANPSQQIHQKPWSFDGPMGLATSTHLYSFEHDHGFSGFANLRALGHPSTSSPIGRLSEEKLRGLAGECFSVPVIKTLCSLCPLRETLARP